MSEELIIKHCSPTLAGIKTANIFTCEYTSEEQLRAQIRRLNGKLVKKGIRIVPLRKSNSRVLIYAYRPNRLERDLRTAEAEKILAQLGYQSERTDGHVNRLARRIREQNGFPHEIGLFLGYPPEDVRGFIENRAKNYKYNGCWKVYGDAEKAKRLFESYKRCTDVYVRSYASGSPIERLAVKA